MKKQASVNQVLNQIEELIQIIKTDRSPLSSDVDQQTLKSTIEGLEKGISAFNKAYLEGCKMAGVEIDHLTHEALESPHINPKEKEAILRAKDLENEARMLDNAFAKAKQKRKKENQGKKDSGSKQQIRERRKQFKTLGADKNWIPL